MLERLGNCSFERRLGADALRHYEQCWHEHNGPHSGTCLKMHGVLLMSKGLWVQALEPLQVLTDTETIAEANPTRTAEALVLRGKIELHMGDLELAVETLHHAYELAPRSHAVYWAYATAWDLVYGAEFDGMAADSDGWKLSYSLVGGHRKTQQSEMTHRTWQFLTSSRPSEDVPAHQSTLLRRMHFGNMVTTRIDETTRIMADAKNIHVNHIHMPQESAAPDAERVQSFPTASPTTPPEEPEPTVQVVTLPQVRVDSSIRFVLHSIFYLVVLEYLIPKSKSSAKPLSAATPAKPATKVAGKSAKARGRRSKSSACGPTRQRRQRDVDLGRYFAFLE